MATSGRDLLEAARSEIPEITPDEVSEMGFVPSSKADVSTLIAAICPPAVTVIEPSWVAIW